MLDPTNPYSAAKAGAEMMCKAYMTRWVGARGGRWCVGPGPGAGRAAEGPRKCRSRAGVGDDGERGSPGGRRGRSRARSRPREV
jgi:NAD(P)-dependent dehydrogenase (short-subunit alcohol dehydrogenase family)